MPLEVIDGDAKRLGRVLLVEGQARQRSSDARSARASYG
jgi:hypothetical protein